MDRKLKFIIFFVGWLVCLDALAVPAKKGVHTVVQPDGSTIEVILCGDEHFNYVMDTDSAILCMDSGGFYRKADACYVERLKSRVTGHRERTMRGGLNDGEVPTTGTLRGLVILAEFTDMGFDENNGKEHFQRLLNEEGYSDNGATGSVRDYYADQSYGLFTPEFDVAGPVRLSGNMEYYGGDKGVTDVNAYRMIQEACTLADEDCGIDFSQYDNNKDGKVDLVYVVYAGYAQSNGASSVTVWPHMWFLSEHGVDLRLDGVAVDRYACSAERAGISGNMITGIGLICHEFSHTLGLPDIYDTSGQLSDIAMGTWDIMDMGCYNNSSRTPAGYSSYEKSALGWLEPEELSVRQENVVLPPLCREQIAYRLQSPVNENEYFLLETRSRSDKWDRYLPGEGMLVVHVDYDKEVWDNNWVNSYGNHRVHIVPANGDFSSATDGESTPFPGSGNVTVFSDLTSPSTVFNDGTAFGMPLTDISYDGENVTFDFGFNMDTPVITEPTDVTATGFRAHWTAVDGAEYYTVRLVDGVTGDVRMFEKIVRNRYTFSGLDPDVTYRYSVQAQSESLTSDFSEEAVIRLSDYQAGIASVLSELDCNGVYSLQGVYLGRSASGLPDGIYVVRFDGGGVSKICIVE